MHYDNYVQILKVHKLMYFVIILRNLELNIGVVIDHQKLLKLKNLILEIIKFVQKFLVT